MSKKPFNKIFGEALSTQPKFGEPFIIHNDISKVQIEMVIDLYVNVIAFYSRN